jgi:hypothetical protein
MALSVRAFIAIEILLVSVHSVLSELAYNSECQNENINDNTIASKLIGKEGTLIQGRLIENTVKYVLIKKVHHPDILQSVIVPVGLLFS